MMRKHRRPLLVLTAVASALALVATGCASEREDGAAEERNESEPFIFAGAGDMRSLDPILASDGETFRVARQAYETLLRHEPGGTEIVPGLAHDWEQSDDGTEWTFFLEEDVTFHDGEEFNADAVCANFERWYNFEGIYQSQSVSYYWTTLFGGFADNDEDLDLPDPNFAGCTPEDEHTVTIEVEEYSPDYPGAFSMIALGMMSPAAIEEMEGEDIEGDPDDPAYPEYSQEVGTVAGTGPYEFVDWDHDAREVEMQRFDDYWDEDRAAQIQTIIFQTIEDENARMQALQSGDIHGYDLVAPADVQNLQDEGFEVPERGVFNILYLAFVQDDAGFEEREDAAEALSDPDVRRALAHAVDRQNIVDSLLPEGGEVATQFMPDTLDGWSDDVPTYDHDPELAEELLADAGYEDLTLDFCYPTEVTRPYMPSPQDIFEFITHDLEEVGIEVEPDSYEWTQYIPHTESGGCSLYLLGWTGDFNEAYNFLGTWFADYRPAWGHDSDAIFDTLDEAAAEPNAEDRVALYEEANEVIMEELPGLPISSSPPSIAFAPDIDPPTVSPLTQEEFAETSFE
ncbi:ABC transporter substrate-binding protein [Lipingzhangella sp. LS1_29]|uniref:ABC transporter substrate-binding protein n=1 Tax=Lipingzhangella rawalii TaxID=2055835 RepID=A0ABU2H5L1_9ACTN|nr:ABC transporter substrate-binding protein [Lipingzhangella rawalii]MDS1270596.1 ABC transporter substrate-binding protein [Lipingzhangella rawalii]